MNRPHGTSPGAARAAASRAAIVVALSALACSESDVSPPKPAVEGTHKLKIHDDGRLEFLDERGQPRLRSLSVPDSSGAVRYGALGFDTALEPELVPPSFEAKDTPDAPDAATRHDVNRVLSTHETADGFVAELGTDDPEGRTLTLTAVDRGGVVRVDLAVNGPSGATGVYASFESPQNEAFHGFGGRREGTDLRGRMLSHWVFDYRFPNLSTAYYYPQPLFLSSAGYALWADTDRLATFRLASDRPDAWRVAVAGSSLALVVAASEGTKALAEITHLTGRHRVAPSFSLGPTLSRTVQLYVDTPSVYRQKVADDVARLLEGDLLVEAYAYEGWALLPADFVAATNASLLAAGIHPLLYIRSFVANDTAGTEPRGRFDDAVGAGLVATHANGEPYLYPSVFPGSQAAVIDFTNPLAVRFWKGLVRQMLETGADGFMGDFGEQVLPDMVFSDGNTGAVVHNRYPLLQHRATREALDEFSAEHPERELFFFVRSGGAGHPGSAAFESAAFPGDESADFAPETGLPSIVPDMLNRSIFGGYGFTTDIGGYADFKGQGVSEELFVRWMEAAVFTTHFRVHNGALSGVRMPWSYGDKTLATWKQMAALHVRARPLLLRLWRIAEETGAPPIRPMWLDEPDPDARALADSEWKVGDDVLVAPVLEEGAAARAVWFPHGCWRLHGDGATIEGPRTASVEAPLRELPWFTRCGTSPLDE